MVELASAAPFASVQLSDAADADPAATPRLDALALADGLSQLPAAEREVVTLFHLEGLPLTEVASVLAIPVGTVKSRLSRTTQQMRATLDAHARLSPRQTGAT